MHLLFSNQYKHSYYDMLVMPAIVIVESSGTLKDVTLKSMSEAEFTKKTGLKLTDAQTSWAVTVGTKEYDVTLYGKLTGRAGQENKYEFPPPVDTELYFGKCAIVNKDGDITAAEWGRVYDQLYGGFDELGDEDSEEDEDDLDGAALTKAGYLKDDFVVDDDEEEDEEEEEEEEEEVETSEDDDVVSSKSKKKKPKAAKKLAIKPKAVRNKASSLEPTYLDCTTELEEEDYI
jgi:hypothetical protein